MFFTHSGELCLVAPRLLYPLRSAVPCGATSALPTQERCALWRHVCFTYSEALCLVAPRPLYLLRSAVPGGATPALPTQERCAWWCGALVFCRGELCLVLPFLFFYPFRRAVYGSATPPRSVRRGVPGRLAALLHLRPLRWAVQVAPRPIPSSLESFAYVLCLPS
jgi:hypothetical protein